MKNKNFIYMVIFAVIVIIIAEMIGAKFVPIGQIKVALLYCTHNLGHKIGGAVFL